MTETKSFLESVWEHREEVLYRRVFGETGPGIYPLPVDLFTRTFGKSCDPRWTTIGVFECPPTAERPSWTYVS